MRSILNRRLLGLALLLVGGCCWQDLFLAGGAQQAPPGPAGPAGPVVGPASGNGNGFRAPAPTPLNGPGDMNEQMSLMSQRLAASEDDKKVLDVRLKEKETQIRDRDKALMQATFEIREATAQVARSREELQRWKQEMENLRGKLGSMERDNKASLEAVIHTLEQFLDREREKEPSKALESSGPVLR